MFVSLVVSVSESPIGELKSIIMKFILIYGKI